MPLSDDEESFLGVLAEAFSKPITTVADIDPECSCVCHEISAMWNHLGRPCCAGAGVWAKERL